MMDKYNIYVLCDALIRHKKHSSGVCMEDVR